MTRSKIRRLLSDICIFHQFSELFLSPHSDLFIESFQMIGNHSEGFGNFDQLSFLLSRVADTKMSNYFLLFFQLLGSVRRTLDRCCYSSIRC